MNRLKQLIPHEAQSFLYRRIYDPLFSHGYLRTSTNFKDIGSKGSLTERVFEKIKDIPGAFNLDDAAHFFCILEMQSLLGMKGDFLEIGTFFGRSTAVMCHSLKTGEVMNVCDAFQSETEDVYTSRPTPEILLNNIRKVTESFDESSLKIHACLSNDLKLDSGSSFRFVHVDGGHSEKQAYFDLQLVAPHILKKGIIAVDDYDHKHWPGVTPAVDRFLTDHANFTVFADLNRHGAIGRKIYLVKT